jgi:hypothetical protein
MPTIAQVEEQILTCEGFRVRLTPLSAATKRLPPFDFLVMAPQRWRVSDWKTVRLGAYVTLLRDVVVLRSDGTPLRTNMQLGNLRDTYYEAKYGSLEPVQPPLSAPEPASLEEAASRRRARSPADRAESTPPLPTKES